MFFWCNNLNNNLILHLFIFDLKKRFACGAAMAVSRQIFEFANATMDHIFSRWRIAIFVFNLQSCTIDLYERQNFNAINMIAAILSVSIAVQIVKRDKNVSCSHFFLYEFFFIASSSAALHRFLSSPVYHWLDNSFRAAPT